MENKALLPSKWRDHVRKLYLKLRQDMPLTYRHLTPEEIKTDYPPDKIADLIRRAQQNARWTYDESEEEKQQH